MNAEIYIVYQRSAEKTIISATAYFSREAAKAALANEYETMLKIDEALKDKEEFKPYTPSQTLPYDFFFYNGPDGLEWKYYIETVRIGKNQ